MRYALVLMLLIFFLSAFILGNRVYTESTHPVAVVTAESVDVLKDPGEGSVVQFTLHNGAEVILLETRDQWTQLSLSGGQFQGWASVKAVEEVNFKVP